MPINRLFESRTRPQIRNPGNAPGIRFGSSGGFNFTGDTAALAGRRTGIAKGFRDLSGETFEGFRRATLADLESQQAQSTGDLKNRLRRRRIAGSSFGNAEIARKQVQDNQQRTLVNERLGMAELDFRAQNLAREAGIVNSAITAALDGARISAGMASQMNQLSQAAFEADRQVLLDSFAGIGQLGVLALS